ncbi:MAG: hypothetical protein WBA12_01145 [Catalinimonas sp.]
MIPTRRALGSLLLTTGLALVFFQMGAIFYERYLLVFSWLSPAWHYFTVSFVATGLIITGHRLRAHQRAAGEWEPTG